jgi:hypothetical protein
MAIKAIAVTELEPAYDGRKRWIDLDDLNPQLGCSPAE